MLLTDRLNDAQLLRDKAYINGGWVAAHEAAGFSVYNPATGAPLATVPDCAAEDTRAAIAAAEQALIVWRETPAPLRASLLRALHGLLLKHEEDLAQLITAEQGKPLAEALGEVRYAAAYVDWFAAEARRTYGDVIPAASADRRLLVVKQPIGVVATITPWNFPLAMLARKVAPALAAGCAVVSKPAEATPLSALALAELTSRAGFPAGVFNVLPTSSGDRVGGELTSNPVVRKLSFTGSTATGKLLLSQCAEGVKKVSLELGGNAPFIVFDDADLEAAVAGAVAVKFRNSGQTCICANRFIVHEKLYDEFAERLALAVNALSVGDGAEAGTDQGPLINAAAVRKVENQLEDAVASGAHVICGGARHERGGSFFQPTVLVNVRGDMRVAREETFGPVAPLLPFQSEAEAVELANQTQAGLAAYFYTADMARAWRVAEQLEYGMVGVNETAISSEAIPFGGIKESGLGREGSSYGIDEYLELKHICMGGLG